MRRKRILWLCILALCAVAGGFYWSLIPSRSVSRAFAEEIRKGPGTVVDLARVAPFAWDRVFVFRPYTPSGQIDTCLGFHWNGARWSAIDSCKGVNLVVFARDAAVVCWFDYPRVDGDLIGLAGPKGFARDEAKFHVTLDNDRRLLLLK